MRHGRFVYILGDVHGDFNALNKFIDKRIRRDKALTTIAPYWKKDGDDLQVVILQCGDFAYFWPGKDNGGKIRNQVGWLAGGRAPIYWIGGNHEDWDRLDYLGSGITEIDRGIFYCPFGSTLELAPDVTVLFAGGAESCDIAERLRYMAQGALQCWWKQEGISDADMARLASVQKADWVVSHTAPSSFYVSDLMDGMYGRTMDDREPSRLQLDKVLRRFSPSRWFFGHFHEPMTGRTNDCEWMCLDELSGIGKSWERVYLEWVD